MSIHAARSASDQIAALVQGVRLPVERIADDYLNIIAEALGAAFEEAGLASPTIMATGTEAEITALLESILKRRIDEDPIWRGVVSHVGRGTESINFDGKKLEKRPDLSITLTAPWRSVRFPVIVEAKVIDRHTGKTAKLYCQNGVRRFQIGDYAWGCQEAFMLAYVRDGSDLLSSLCGELLAKDINGTSAFGTLTELEARTFPRGELATSNHARSFVYGHQSLPDNAPGPISLWHIWLRVPTA